jgi:tetratricopeptide (TPR) repeat protein
LWDVLRTGLQTSQKDGASVVIITDGCDGIVGGDKNAIAFHTALRKSVSKLTEARVITFSRPVSHLSDGCRHIVITPQDSYEDIRVHLGQTLLKSPHFQHLNPSARDQLIDELTAKSKGNFLWAYYAGHLFRLAPQDNYAKLKQSITSDISNILQHTIIESRFKNNATLRELLSFMLVAQRPLLVDEVADLLAVDIANLTIQSKTVDLLKYVPDNCGDVVIIRGGRLHFRSSAVRSYLLQQMGGLLLSLTDAHLQLTQRALLYARCSIKVDRELTIDGLSEATVDELFESNRFLLYVVQTWTVHFKQAGLLSQTGQISLPKGFSEIFPDSVTFALVEQSYWRRTYSLETLITLHELSLQVRDASFGSKHVTRIQTLISLSHAHYLISSTSTHSTSYLVQAIRLGVSIFSESSVFVSACVSLFLTWTENIVIKERTETVTYREEVIRIMIRICQHKHGHSSDQVIQWYEKLAQLYTDIGEKQHATVVYRELYQIITVRHGKKSEKAREIGMAFGTLDVVLNGEDAVKDIAGLEVLIFETNDDLEASDKMSIAMTIRLAQSYLVSGKFFLAERLYLTLWKRLTVLCTADSRFDIHIAKIQIALEYVKFLHKVKRSDEAANILICLWAEYEHYVSESEALTVWIREIGISCRSFGLLSIAASILTKVWGWFKSKGKLDNEEAKKTTILVTEVVEEITETTVTKKTTKITTTEVTETVVKEIFELHYQRCQKTKADHAFFSSCMALFGVYTGTGRWADAAVAMKRALELTWTAVLSADLKISLSSHSTKETIVVARQLALCYQRQGFFEQAESIHLRIYYACLHSTTFVEELLHASISHLIEFYEHHHRHEKVIEVYTEILEKYRKQYGLTHRLTIETLYLLAAQYELLGRADAFKYYLEIVTNLNKGIKHCHADAVKAALFLCRYYRARNMWVELRTICEGVWGTITHDNKHGGLKIEVITEVYNNYVYVLEVHAKVEFSVIYKLRVQYKDVAIAVSGAVSSAALLAMIELAGYCEKYESHRHESVKIYEEVLKITRTTKTTETIITETTVQTVKKRLSTLYVTIVTTGKSDATTKQTVDRAIEIALESYAHLKVEYGCWHETTLLKLKEVVLLYRQSATQEANLKIIQLLQVSVIEIISTLTVTASLFSSAKLLASIYISAGQVAKGQELLHQLRHLIIFREGWKTSEITLSIEARVTRSAFAFLIAFELGLSGKTNQALYSELMADIVFESVLFEEYSRVIEKETKLDIILDSGAKLRRFWEEHKRVHLLAILDKKLLQLFVSQYSESFKGIAENDVRIFYLTILAELAKNQAGTKIDLASLACRAGNVKVRTLIENKELHQAHLLGRCVFQFASKQKLYQQINFVQYGYKLAELLAGTEITLPTDSKYDDDKKAMLQTSRNIIAEVLATSRAANIDFARLQFEDLSGLLHLLGAQGNYSELVLILTRLWACREELQKANGWSPSMVLRIGNMLIHAQQNNKDTSGAIATAELLYYNVRRGRGRLDPETLALSRLLASLYLSAGRSTTAISVHGSVLREIASTCQEHENSRPKLTPEATQQLELLRSAYHQAKTEGKPVSEFGNLYEQVKLSLKLELPAFDQWLQNNKTAHNSKYTTNIGWKLERDVQYYEMWKRSVRERPK